MGGVRRSPGLRAQQEWKGGLVGLEVLVGGTRVHGLVFGWRWLGQWGAKRHRLMPVSFWFVQQDEREAAGWGVGCWAPAVCKELKIQACARPPGLPHGAHSPDEWCLLDLHAFWEGRVPG